MTPFTNFESRMVPLPINNIDTDQIIPARFLKTTSKEGLDKQLFNDWRYDADGQSEAGFRPEQAARRKARRSCWPGDNFGCGSSREHAPWALTQCGFRAVISTTFADIFKQNSLKNSLLPIVVPPDVHAELFAAGPGAIVKIDLPNQTLTTPSGRVGRVPGGRVLQALPGEGRRRTRLHPGAGSRDRRVRKRAPRGD